MLQKCSLLEGLARGLSGKILARQGLEFDLQNSCKQQNKNGNPGVVVHACNPSTGKAETGGPLAFARQLA